MRRARVCSGSGVAATTHPRKRSCPTPSWTSLPRIRREHRLATQHSHKHAPHSLDRERRRERASRRASMRGEAARKPACVPDVNASASAGVDPVQARWEGSWQSVASPVSVLVCAGVGVPRLGANPPHARSNPPSAATASLQVPSHGTVAPIRLRLVPGACGKTGTVFCAVDPFGGRFDHIPGGVDPNLERDSPKSGPVSTKHGRVSNKSGRIPTNSKVGGCGGVWGDAGHIRTKWIRPNRGRFRHATQAPEINYNVMQPRRLRGASTCMPLSLRGHVDGCNQLFDKDAIIAKQTATNW